MLKGKFSSRRHVTEEVDAMAGVANLADVMLVFACGLMAAVILNWNVDRCDHWKMQEHGVFRRRSGSNQYE